MIEHSDAMVFHDEVSDKRRVEVSGKKHVLLLTALSQVWRSETRRKIT